MMVYLGPGDVQTVKNESEIPEEKMILTQDREKIKLGSNSIEFIHTPGHTPGSQCILINGSRLLTGDTLFIGSCGRTDLPGGNLHELYCSLQYKLGQLNDNIHVFPGHHYNGYRTSIKKEKEHGLLKPMCFERFEQIVSGGRGVKI